MNNTILIILLVVILAIMLVREVALWYFRINEIVALLREIRDAIKDCGTIKNKGQEKSEPIMRQS